MHIHTIQLNIEKMLGGCVTMDATEFGAYMSIIVALYQTGGRLPNDDKKLARIARVTIRKWTQIKQELEPKFDVSGSFWEHKVVSQQLVKYHTLATKNKANSLKANKTSEPVGQPDASQTAANTSNKEQVTSNKERKKEYKPQLSEAVDLYNITAENIGLSKIAKLTDSRKTKLNARLNDCGGIEGWKTALDKLSQSEFLRGNNDRGWKASFDFILTESKFTKLMEDGYYQKPQQKKETRNDIIDRQARELIEEGRTDNGICEPAFKTLS